MAEDGFYDYSIEETEIKAAMVSQSKRNIVLMDSSKFGRVSVARVSELSNINMLITEKIPPEPLLESLDAAGVEILIASSVVTEMRKEIYNGF